MSFPSLYDEKSLASLTQFQKEKEWDLENSIDWNLKIDLNKPLVPLDQDAILFPGAGKEERLVISQMMGLIIAVCIWEMEECLIRFRKQSWEEVLQRFPVSPEFYDLGEQFFSEEEKHSAAFRRYLSRFANELQVDQQTLVMLLPSIRETRTENILKKNIEKGGQAFWWIVTSVEQEFLLLYHHFSPFHTTLEPLYFTLHKKHFEEEARHAPFPYLMLELLATRNSSWFNALHVKGDLILAEFLQTAWTFRSLSKMKQIKEVAHLHPFFEVLARVYPSLENQPLWKVMWRLLTSTPYVSSLVNPKSHPKVLKFARKLGAVSSPFPKYSPANFVKSAHG